MLSGPLPAVEEADAPRLPIAEAVLDEIGWRTGYSPVSDIDYGMCLRRSHLDDALIRTASSVRPVARRATRPEYAQILSDIYNRVQAPSSMLPLTALPSLILGALRQPASSTREVVADVRTQVRRIRDDRNERRALVRASAG
ncbi:hypothetical protein R4144_08535 [Gordonia amicalis]|uniref:hypothetical protein n=1 Tax=Gordonia amicalis TaxID=89053 RepID=UPI001EDFCE35|nr:hypothetical protein [Gordonia amicalis]MDV7173435.1 hypothetical protein [Gordonia amicalis]UKO93911.1 hypothetical protein IHQ52_11835 [Gordonia amicalis]UOG21525.1 hypothetical protein MTX80_22005 [Gordonia amicalis]